VILMPCVTEWWCTTTSALLPPSCHLSNTRPWECSSSGSLLGRPAVAHATCAKTRRRVELASYQTGQICGGTAHESAPGAQWSEPEAIPTPSPLPTRSEDSPRDRRDGIGSTPVFVWGGDKGKCVFRATRGQQGKDRSNQRRRMSRPRRMRIAELDRRHEVHV
jgi:hypothetical protein